MPRKLTIERLICIAGLVALAEGQAVATTAVQPLPLDVGLGISTVSLWDGPPQGARSPANADVPTLTVFTPQPGKGTGTAVVVAPGGAYVGLASNLEGRQVADWFTARGVTAFVLKYRLGANNLFPIPLLDAQRAIRLVRSYEKRYGLAPTRIGIVGFSAGGHLAALAGTLNDEGNTTSADPVERMSDRPDFMVLGYPWLNAMEPNHQHLLNYCTQMGIVSAEQCQGFEQQYTPSRHVTSKTPPTFIYSTSDDATVPISASVEFYNALHAAGVLAELHIFGHGAHGSGLGSAEAALDVWPALLEQWLRDQGFLTPDPAAVAAQKAAMTAPARQPGEHLSLDSRIADILADPAAAAAIARICGPDFLQALPAEAAEVSLHTIAPYFPAQLSDRNIEAIRRTFAKLPLH